MAITPQNSDVFLREVDEELRRDELASFWRRYGRWLIAGLIGALLAFAGYLYWQHHRETVAEQTGARFDVALDALAAGQRAAAAAPLAEVAASPADGYRAMAQFTQADVALQANDLKTATAKFAAVAGDGSLPDAVRHLALVRQTSAEFDQLAPKAVVDRLGGIAVAGNPYFGSAGELVAAAYLRMNRRAEAGRLFAAMAQDRTVPASIRQRAVQLAGVLGVDANVTQGANGDNG